MKKIAEIQHNERLLLEAMKESDIDQLDHLMHDDLLFVDAMGGIINKEIDIANYRSGKLTIEDIEASEQTIRLFDNTAVVTVKIKLKGKYLTHIIDENLQFIRIWIEQSGVWKIIGGSSVRT